MVTISLCILLLVFGVAWICSKEGDFEDKGLISLGLAIVLGLLCFFFVHFEGLLPGYSVGQREGFLTKLSEKGVFWKTFEGEMQLGVGEAASLQPPFEFCVPDAEVRAQVEKLLGKKVSVKYTQWVVIPWRRGGVSHEITEVTVHAQVK